MTTKKRRLFYRLFLGLVAFIGIIGLIILWHGMKDWKSPLEQAVAGADRLELVPVQSEVQEVLFKVEGESKIRELIALMEFDSWRSLGRCMCLGDMEFRFYKGDKHLVSIAYAHGEHFKWRGGPWNGDAVLTAESRLALPRWFKDQGYSRFEDARLARIAQEQEERREADTFASHFPEDVRHLVVKQSSWGGPNLGGDKRAGKKLAEQMADPVSVVIAVSGALSVSSRPMGTTTEKERRALAAAATVDGSAFLSALGCMEDDRNHMRGAARLFFGEGMGERLPRDRQGEWGARLAEVVFADGLDEDKCLVLRRLGTLKDQQIRSLLRKVADGQFGNEIDRNKVYGQEPGLRAGALLCLALQGDESIRSRIEALLPEVQAEEDRQALEVSLVLLGDHSRITQEPLTLESYLITRAAITGIEQFDGVYGLDALVEGGSQHEWALIRNEAGAAFDRITGQRFGVNTSPFYDWESAKAWWQRNREQWMNEHRP
jgi:hypothetical protein